MPTRPVSVILIVVGTLATVSLLYAGTLAYCAAAQVSIPLEVGGAFKDFALVSLGALGALLTRTSTNDGAALRAEITNTPDRPVPTTTE